MKPARARVRDDLLTAPGIGPSLAQDLRDLGVRSVADLRRQDPERLYTRLNRLRGVRQDPCVLYAFRCAVYYARADRPAPKLLKWWNWKDRTSPAPRPLRRRTRRQAARASAPHRRRAAG